MTEHEQAVRIAGRVNNNPDDELAEDVRVVILARQFTRVRELLVAGVTTVESEFRYAALSKPMQDWLQAAKAMLG